jgi:ligand-binding SRPBCC domain-containing protein
MAATVQAPTNTTVFEHRSEFKGVTPEAVRDFHAAPGAFSRLTPPPVFIQIHRNDLDGLTAGEVEFTLWVTFIPIAWLARHEPGENEYSFNEGMVTGPMAYWHHEHIVRPTDDGAELVDRITMAHPSGVRGLLTRLMFSPLPLRGLFTYRHLRTRLAVR